MGDGEQPLAMVLEGSLVHGYHEKWRSRGTCKVRRLRTCPHWFKIFKNHLQLWGRWSLSLFSVYMFTYVLEPPNCEAYRDPSLLVLMGFQKLESRQVT